MTLDHLYFGCDPESFEGFCKTYTDSRYAVHQVVNVTDSSWEGLYVHCRNKTYFEFLKERRLNKLGIGFRSSTLLEEGPPTEVRKLSHLNWKWGTRRFPDGRFWFNWFSLTDDREMETPFDFWIMQYDASWMSHLHARPARISPYESIQRLNLQAPFLRKGEFLQNSRYFQELVSDHGEKSNILVSGAEISIQWLDVPPVGQIRFQELRFRN